jgi:aminoglycoside phosphotransferase
VYRLLRQQQAETAMYLKHGRRGGAAQALADKAARLSWLGDALPCQRLLHFERRCGPSLRFTLQRGARPQRL